MTTEGYIEDNLPIVTLITLQRVYDVLALMLKNINEEDWEKVMLIHQSGGFATPGPILNLKEEE